MKESLLLFVCLPLIFFGCAEKKTELLVDEIYISKHVVAPPLKSTTRFVPPGFKPIKEYLAERDSFDTMYNFCQKGVEISHSVYLPKLVIRLNKQGKMQAYYKNCSEMKEGYYETLLPDSIILFINSYIQKINYSKADTAIICGYHPLQLDGRDYFISFKKDTDEKIFFYIRANPDYITPLIDSLQKYISQKTLQPFPSNYFRKDTLILLTTEKTIDEINKKYGY